MTPFHYGNKSESNYCIALKHLREYGFTFTSVKHETFSINNKWFIAGFITGNEEQYCMVCFTALQ